MPSIFISEKEVGCSIHGFTLSDLRRNQCGIQKGIRETVCSTCNYVGNPRVCITEFWSDARIGSANETKDCHPDHDATKLGLRKPGSRGYVEASSTKKRRRN